MTDIEPRIAEWTGRCNAAANSEMTAAQLFEQSIRDMRHAGYRLPAEVVSAVRSNLAREG